MKPDQIPVNSYGVIIRDQFVCEIEEITEEIRRVGFSKIDLLGCNYQEPNSVEEYFDSRCNEG